MRSQLITGSLILLVVVIGLTLALNFLPGTSADRAKFYLSKAQANQLSEAVGAFVIRHGRLPVELDELSGDPKSHGPRQRHLSKQELLDPWLRPYTLRASADGRSVEVIGLGRDGLSGGEDVDADILVSVHLQESATP